MPGKYKRKDERPNLGSGGAEQAARDIEGHRNRRQRALAQATGSDRYKPRRMRNPD